ncbi:hypothetical protein [Vibrio superstes]|nr:hypothetical protein [Vibrio superstes]
MKKRIFALILLTATSAVADVHTPYEREDTAVPIYGTEMGGIDGLNFACLSNEAYSTDEFNKIGNAIQQYYISQHDMDIKAMIGSPYWDEGFQAGASRYETGSVSKQLKLCDSLRSHDIEILAEKDIWKELSSAADKYYYGA